MVFKNMMRVFGVGGPSVETVLANPHTRPGLTLGGQVQVLGGDHDVTIEHIALGLVTRVESAHGDDLVEFSRVAVSGEFRLGRGERRDVPFSFPVPWEAPVTEVYGGRLAGMTMGLRTELAVARSIDRGDLDEVAVHPLPIQERILDALARSGFRFARADLEHGVIHGVHQQLPFFQEIEFRPPAHLADVLDEIELTFVADPTGVEVILEIDKRAGLLTAGHDAYGRFRAAHEEADSIDWPTVVDSWIHHAVGRYQGLCAGHGHSDRFPDQHGGFPGGHAAPLGPDRGYPVDPGHHDHPAGPGFPAGPGHPTHDHPGLPVDHGYAVDSCHPTYPGRPVHYDHRTHSGFPADNGYSAGPGYPAAPGYPAGPGYPVGAGYPAGPGHTTHPDVPVDHGYPVDPGHPAHLGQSSYPGGPADYGYPADHGSARRGPGIGAVAAGAAGGVLGGMILGEVVEEIFEDDEPDSDE